jgi:hypothetical protein
VCVIFFFVFQNQKLSFLFLCVSCFFLLLSIFFDYLSVSFFLFFAPISTNIYGNKTSTFSAKIFLMKFFFFLQKNFCDQKKKVLSTFIVSLEIVSSLISSLYFVFSISSFLFSLFLKKQTNKNKQEKRNDYAS